MTHELRKVEVNVSPVGEANPLRGAGYHESAVAFLKAFPVGTSLNSSQFDAFILTNQLVKAPSSTDKGSDGWQAFLQRRHQAKINLNKAGSHPRMIDQGLEPFVISQLGANALQVKTPYQAVLTTPLAKSVETLVNTKRTALRHLMQSIDYEQLPPNAQSQVQNVSDTIDDFKASVEFNTDRLNMKFEKLRAQVELMVLSGIIKPKNSGITNLIEGGDLPEEE